MSSSTKLRSGLGMMLAVFVLVVGAIAIYSRTSYVITCWSVESLASDLGAQGVLTQGRAKQFQILFERTLTDEELRRIVATVKDWDEVSLSLLFTGDVSDARMEEMRATLEPYSISVSSGIPL